MVVLSITNLVIWIAIGIFAFGIKKDITKVDYMLCYAVASVGLFANLIYNIL